MYIPKNLSALVVLVALTVVTQVQASPVANLEKRDTYGCPSTQIRCAHHCQTDFQPALQGMTKLGTEFYLAPEVVKEEEYHTLAIDVWSFGCVLYEMRVGEWTGLTTWDVDYMADPLGGSTFLSKDLNGLLGKMLERLPDQRHTAEEVTMHDFFTRGHCPQSFSWNIFVQAPSYSEEGKRKLEDTVENANYSPAPEQDDKRPRIVESADGDQGASPGEYVEVPGDQSMATEGMAMVPEQKLAQEQAMTIETEYPRLDNNEVRSYLNRLEVARGLWIHVKERLEEEGAKMATLGRHSI